MFFGLVLLTLFDDLALGSVIVVEGVIVSEALFVGFLFLETVCNPVDSFGFVFTVVSRFFVSIFVSSGEGLFRRSIYEFTNLHGFLITWVGERVGWGGL